MVELERVQVRGRELVQELVVVLVLELALEQARGPAQERVRVLGPEPGLEPALALGLLQAAVAVQAPAALVAPEVALARGLIAPTVLMSFRETRLFVKNTGVGISGALKTSEMLNSADSMELCAQPTLIVVPTCAISMFVIRVLQEPPAVLGLKFNVATGFLMAIASEFKSLELDVASVLKGK